MQGWSSDEFNVATASKRMRVTREFAQTYYDSATGTFGGHGAEQLAYDSNANLRCTILFALHHYCFRTFAQYQINAAVRPTAAAFGHFVAALTKSLARNLFELTPIHLIERTGRRVGSHIGSEAFAFVCFPRGNQRSRHQPGREHILPDHR